MVERGGLVLKSYRICLGRLRHDGEEEHGRDLRKGELAALEDWVGF